MGDREGRLNDLNSESSTLQGTADQFTRQSKALQWDMQWQRYKLWILCAALVVWAILIFMYFKNHELTFIVLSVAFFGLLIFTERALVKRWRSQVEQGQQLTQLTRMPAA